MGEEQAKNVKKGKEVAKGDDFKSSAFFRKLQVCIMKGNERQEETSSTISEIKDKMIEKKKKVGGESASFKL